MRNEEVHLHRCLASVVAQDYPADRLEVLIYDGSSTDRSREIAAGFVTGRPGWALSDNPARIQAAAWNLGIERATGDIVGILSGHATLGPQYVTAAVSTLERTGAAMVGGPVRAVATSPMGVAIAVALSTPFGVGGARFRYTAREEEVDTVFMGVCRRETYLRFRFSEDMVRNQDDELSYRILDNGGRIVCDPQIESSYQVRTSLRDLWHQYFQYGFWKVRVMQEHPAQIRPRQLVPPALVGVLLAGLLLTPLWAGVSRATAVLVGSYAAASVTATALVSRGRGRLLWRLPAVFAAVHFAYGAGVLMGLIRFGNRWSRWSIKTALRSLTGRARR
jgi:succinoglycan biosynthesis protein ExoA